MSWMFRNPDAIWFVLMGMEMVLCPIIGWKFGTALINYLKERKELKDNDDN